MRIAAASTPRLTTRRSLTTTTSWPPTSVGDTYDNALAESFVDSFKIDLIADRVWRSPSQLELAVVDYNPWLNNDRLHSALGYATPGEHEANRKRRSNRAPTAAGSGRHARLGQRSARAGSPSTVRTNR